MAGGAGAALVALAAAPTGTAAQGLRVGVVYEGTIRIDGNAVSLLIGGQALSLKTALEFMNGQRVQAQLVRTPEGLQARITLPGGQQPAPARPGAPAPQAPLPQAPQPGQTAPNPAGTHRNPQGTQPNLAQTPGNAPPPTAAPGNPARPAVPAKPGPLPQSPGNARPAQAPSPANPQSSHAPSTPQTPQAQGQPSAVATQAAQLARVAAEVARGMPQASDPERLATLLPRQLPASEPLVRAAMQVMAAREAGGSDLATVTRAFATAAERGVIPASTAGFVLAFQVADGAEPDSWFHAVRRWVEAASKPLEARLAAALRGGAEGGKPLDLGQELRSVLIQARADEGIARALQREGDVDAFRQALDRTIDRLTGSQAQNLRAFDGPYIFAELPGGERFLRAQLHILGDGSPQGKHGGSRQVVLDVSMQRLGDLWLALSVAGPRCQCTVRVADPAVLPEFAEAADELEEALKEAGYPNSEVRVLGWDGDRVAALAGVLASHDRLDLEA